MSHAEPDLLEAGVRAPSDAILALADHLERVGRDLVGDGRGDLLALSVGFLAGRLMGQAGHAGQTGAVIRAIGLGFHAGGRRR